MLQESEIWEFAELVRSNRKSSKKVLQDHGRNFQDRFQDSYQGVFPNFYKILAKIFYKISELLSPEKDSMEKDLGANELHI